MPRATKEKFLVCVNNLSPIRAADWNRYLDVIFESILKDEAPIYAPKMNAYLEGTVAKYPHSSDDYISLTEIARKFDAENPSYLIQSWLRSRNTVELLVEWERRNNQDFNKAAFQKLVVAAKTPQFTLPPKKWIDLTNATSITSKRARAVERRHTNLLRVNLRCGMTPSLDTKYRNTLAKTIKSKSSVCTVDLHSYYFLKRSVVLCPCKPKISLLFHHPCLSTRFLYPQHLLICFHTEKQ